MEDWQIKHIQRNLPNLIKWTNCNTQLLAILQAEGVLGEDDVEELECTAKSSCKAKLLYDILKIKVNAYYILVKALIDIAQTGAAKLLLEIPIEKMSKLQVKFLGNIQILESLLNPYQIKSIQSWLQKNASMEELLNISKDILSQDIAMQLMHDTIPEPYPLYIPRLLSHRTEINPELFEKKCPDIFVFRNAERTKLRKFVHSYAIEYSSSQLLRPNITARFIILDAESNWKKICNKVTSPAHLIRYEDETQRFLLEETTGDSAILRQFLIKSEEKNERRNTSAEESNKGGNFVLKKKTNPNSFYKPSEGYFDTDDDSDDNFTSNKDSESASAPRVIKRSKNYKKSEDDVDNAGIAEDDFVKRVTKENMKCIAICDLPGMGKSFLLASLARKMNLGYPDRIVGFIQLQNFILAHTSSNDIQENVQSQILTQLATSKLSYCILVELLKHKNIKFELFFDGLDEVRESQLKLTTAFLQTLVTNMPNAGVFVTSRPVVQDELEKALRVIAYDIVPFNAETQLKFLVSHWKQTEPDADPVRLEKYATVCLNSIEKFLNEKEKNITGIPLLCKLIADVYGIHAGVYADKNSNIPIELPVNSTHSLLQIYSKFITRQLGESNCNFECFYETNLLEKKCRKTCQVRNFYIWQALKIIFPKLASKLVELVPHYEEFNVHDILTPGILRKNTQNQNWEFLHRTFAEYLVAEYFWKGVFRNSKLKLKKELEQDVFNMVLNVDGSKHVWYMTLREGVVAYFLDCMITESQRNENLVLRPLSKMSPLNDAYFAILETCICWQYERLLELFLKATENNKLLCRIKKPNLFRRFVNSKQSKLVLEWQKENGKYEELEISPRTTTHILNKAAEHCSAQDYDRICVFFQTVINIDLNEYVWTPPIKVALRQADFEQVRYFADKMSLKNHELLYECFSNTYFDTFEVTEKKLDIAEFLLSRCPSLITERWKDRYVEYKTPIHVRQISLRALKFLVQKGCDILVPSYYGTSVVYSAARYMTDEDFFELCRFICIDCRAKNYFLDPENWIHYVPNFECITRTHTSKSLFKILCYLKIEIEFVENIRSFKKLGVYQKYKQVFHSLLYCAFMEEKLDFVDWILTHDKSLFDLKCYRKPKSLFYNKMTATLYTANCKKLAMLRVFVSRGSNVFTVTSRGETILHVAAQTRDCDFFHTVLCMLGEKWNEIQNIEELIASVSHGSGGKPESILELFNWPSNDSETPLHKAVRWLKGLPLRTLDLLLSCGRKHADANAFTLVNINEVNRYRQTALHIALKTGQRLELVKHLISRGADWTLTTSGESVAHYCLEGRLVDHLMYFVELGCDVNSVDQNGDTPLIYALKTKQSLEFVKNLVRAGADWSTRSIDGSNIAHACANYGLVEHLKYFVELGCDINEVDLEGYTPFFYALINGLGLKLIKYLVGVGADFSVRDLRGRNAAHICGGYGKPEHLKYFVQLGCDVNVTDENGDNALQFAARYCDSSEIIQILISAGVDKTNKNKKDKTAYDIAANRNAAPEILKLMRLPHCADITAGKTTSNLLWMYRTAKSVTLLFWNSVVPYFLSSGGETQFQ